MEYCGVCGEPAEGRFCRMCGAPVGADENAALSFAAAQAQSRAYGPAQGGVGVPGPATAPAGLAGPEYGPEPTELLGATATPAEFDSYFRSEDGSPGAHGQTQLLPPVVDDYRMRPPRDDARTPPGGPAGPRSPADEDDARPNHLVIFVTLGAVVVVAAVILGLLYLGGRGTSSNTAGGTGPSAVAGGTATQGTGVISIPTDGATLSPPSPAAPSTGAAVGQFHGDGLPLGPGSSGAWVRWVQEKLKALGYYHGTASGTFDQATALAVQQFQAAANVTGDPASTAGKSTLVALAAAGSTPDLRPGARSPEVARLNSALSLATGEQLSGNRYTKTTAQAVAKYQAAVGLAPTGQVDAATWARLQTGTVAAG